MKSIKEQPSKSIKNCILPTHFILILAILLWPSLAKGDLADGLVGSYPFSGNANNALGTGNNGTVNGATLIADRYGNPGMAYGFNGNNSINFSSGPPVSSSGSFTYSFWIKSTKSEPYPVYPPNSWIWFVDRTTETAPIVSLGILTEDYADHSRNQFLFLWREDGQHQGGAGELIGGTMIPNQWQHIAMVREYGSLMKLYVDGVLVGSAADPGYALTPPALQIGMHAWNGQLGLVGGFDDLRIYNRALSAREVQSLNIPMERNESAAAPAAQEKPDVVQKPADSEPNASSAERTQSEGMPATPTEGQYRLFTAANASFSFSHPDSFVILRQGYGSVEMLDEKQGRWLIAKDVKTCDPSWVVDLQSIRSPERLLTDNTPAQKFQFQSITSDTRDGKRVRKVEFESVGTIETVKLDVFFFSEASATYVLAYACPLKDFPAHKEAFEKIVTTFACKEKAASGQSMIRESPQNPATPPNPPTAKEADAAVAAIFVVVIVCAIGVVLFVLVIKSSEEPANTASAPSVTESSLSNPASASPPETASTPSPTEIPPQEHRESVQKESMNTASASSPPEGSSPLVIVKCPHCNEGYRFRPENVGTGRECRRCGKYFVAAATDANDQQSWYFSLNGVAYGPVTKGDLESRLNQGQLFPTTLVCSDSVPQWAEAQTVNTLHFTKRFVPPPLPNQPQAPLVVTTAGGLQSQSPSMPQNPISPPPSVPGTPTNAAPIQPPAPPQPPQSPTTPPGTGSPQWPAPPGYYPPPQINVTLPHDFTHKGKVIQVEYDKSANGRLMKVWAKVFIVIAVLAIGFGFHANSQNQHSDDGKTAIVIGFVILIPSIFLHIFGAIYEGIYRRDSRR